MATLIQPGNAFAQGVHALDVRDYDPADFPAGKVFFRDGTPSTHLNAVVGDDEGYRVIPMLVPGQKDVERLLEGRRATPEQIDIAIGAANARGTAERYKTVDEALAAEAKWRATHIPRIEKLVRRMLEGR